MHTHFTAKNKLFSYSNFCQAVLTSSEKMASYSNVANEGQDVLNAYKKKFDAFDLNRNGLISMREFAAVSMRSGYKMSKEDIIVSVTISSETHLIC